MDIEKEFKDILQDYIEFPVSELDTRLPLKYAAALNSFMLMKLVTDVEAHFQITIPTSDLSPQQSADDVLAYLKRRLS